MAAVPVTKASNRRANERCAARAKWGVAYCGLDTGTLCGYFQPAFNEPHFKANRQILRYCALQLVWFRFKWEGVKSVS